MALPAPASSSLCLWLQCWVASKQLDKKTLPDFGGLRLECPGDEGSSLCLGRDNGLLEHHCREGATRAVLVPQLPGDFYPIPFLMGKGGKRKAFRL